MASEELKDIFHRLLRPEIASKAANWLQTSSLAEQKGLRIIAAVTKTNGQRKFKRKDQTQFLGIDRHNAAAELTRRGLKSTYELEYQGNTPHAGNTAIFSYRKLTDLSYASLLKEQTVEALQRWLDMGDDEGYRQLVLECVRSISAALANSESKRLTEARREFAWRPGQRQAQAVSARPAPKPDFDSFVSPVPPAKPIRSITPHEVRGSALTAEDMKKMKQALIVGHRNLGRWIVAPEKMLSGYQEDFVPYFSKPAQRLVLDFHTSISLGKMCPDLTPKAS